ncbi:MAG: squalene/phytoene synthase family protein [Rhodospirillales bacterium]|nr:squalene/phytoene synthase family protein [Rhodospirillales bacterium]
MTMENYNQTFLQQHDPDRYLVSLFAPKDRREALWALFCFNYEISKTRFVVTETQLGLIRLQWWRDELEKLYAGDTASENPVLQGLEAALRDYALPKALFDNLLFAREFDLEGVQPQGLEGLINYADLMTTPLNKLALQISGDDPTAEGVQEVSVRYALTQLFRHIPDYEENRFVLIGAEMRDPLRDFLNQKLKIKSLPPVLKSQKSISDIYIKKLKRAGFDPYNSRMKRPPAMKELRVFLSVSCF